MPRNNQLKKILLIGSGPIVIGQGCEFDYSGVQACKALREEGYEVVLVNSNPATIMTDPEFADRTYIEPITPEVIEAIMEREKPEAILPTLGGQTALNAAMELNRNGALARHGVKLIGANAQAIAKGEDRQLFKEAMLRIGLDVPRSGVARSLADIDRMGVHTGDSITVAPAQTLTDKEYQMMRDDAFAVIREIGVETGGSNIQFAVNPDNGRMVVIEMNPRVSRSSALASKATGFPIAKIAAKLAVGYTLDEIKNDITRETPACFEPTIDYCVVKVPRFTFEKFPQAEATLTTRMKSVGEAMAIGRTFKEALQKALRSLEIKRFGLCGDGADRSVDPETRRLQAGSLHDQSGRMPELRPLAAQAAQRNTGFQPVPSSEHPARNVAFHGFDPHGEVIQRRRNLPHREQPGATYFVTFRLGDSVPEALLLEWREEQKNWLKHHPKPWDWKTEREHKRRFVEDREDWLDQSHGSCLLRDSRAARIVADALRHFDLKRYVIDAFVIMPNHVHVLVQSTAGHSLPDIVHSWKSFTGNAINGLLNRDGQVWMPESYDHIVRDWRELLAIRQYIAANPEKAGLSDGEFVLGQMHALVPEEQAEQPGRPLDLSGKMPELLRAKKLGFSDRQLAFAANTSENEIRAQRISAGVLPTYRLVDTCAAEFEAYTPYYYSTYGDENERRESGKRKIMILGGGPNRIGQGIEFDYCCVHAAFALRELGFETIMVNSNPETVSTDYDTSDKLYFEPLTLEDVLNIYDQEQPEGVFVQFGGQTPLNLASGLKAADVPILGTQPESIETAEDRKLFAAMLDRLGLRQTPNGSATSTKEAVRIP